LLIKQLNIFADLLKNTPLENITPPMIESAGCQFIIDDSYREEIIRFSFIIPDELEILAFAYLAFRIWELKEDDSEADKKVYLEIVGKIISKSPFFINELGEDKFTQLITDLLLPLMEGHLWEVITCLEVLGNKLKGEQLTEEHILVIKSGLSEELFMKFPSNDITKLPWDKFGKFYLAGVKSFGDADEIFYQWLNELELASEENYLCFLHHLYSSFSWEVIVAIPDEFGELISVNRINNLSIMREKMKELFRSNSGDINQNVRNAIAYFDEIDDSLKMIVDAQKDK